MILRDFFILTAAFIAGQFAYDLLQMLLSLLFMFYVV